MAIDANSAVGQAETANDKLAEYFSAMSKYAADTTGTLNPPDFTLVADSLDYSELLRMSRTKMSDAPSYEAGASTENIHQMAAVIREFGLRSKGKVDYYNDAESDFLSESNYYATMKVYWVNMLNGIFKEGGGAA